MENQILNRAKKFAVRHSGKAVALVTATVATVGKASAMSAESISNGSSLLTAGISVAQTEPLGSIISMFAVIIGALGFIKIVRRLY